MSIYVLCIHNLTECHDWPFANYQHHSKSLSTIFFRRTEMLTIGRNSRRCPPLSSLLERRGEQGSRNRSLLESKPWRREQGSRCELESSLILAELPWEVKLRALVFPQCFNFSTQKYGAKQATWAGVGGRERRSRSRWLKT